MSRYHESFPLLICIRRPRDGDRAQLDLDSVGRAPSRPAANDQAARMGPTGGELEGPILNNSKMLVFIAAGRPNARYSSSCPVLPQTNCATRIPETVGSRASLRGGSCGGSAGAGVRSKSRGAERFRNS